MGSSNINSLEVGIYERKKIPFRLSYKVRFKKIRKKIRSRLRNKVIFKKEKNTLDQVK